MRAICAGAFCMPHDIPRLVLRQSLFQDFTTVRDGASPNKAVSYVNCQTMHQLSIELLGFQLSYWREGNSLRILW